MGNREWGLLLESKVFYQYAAHTNNNHYSPFLRFLFASLICFSLITSCEKPVVNHNFIAVNNTEPDATITAIPDPLRIRAREIASSLDDRLLAAQLLISGIDGRGGLLPHIETLFTDYPPGGVMLFSYNLNTETNLIRNHLSQIFSLIYDKSGISPFIAVDHEGGTVYRFQNDVAVLPAASFYLETFRSQGREKALEKIADDVFKSGRELQRLGINMNFAPVAELLTDDNRVFLEKRSYGSDPYFTAEASAEFIRAMKQSGVICVVKHFPGSAGPDPHYSPSVMEGGRAEIDALVFAFSHVIKNGARAVMVAHSSVPAIDNKIASLSQIVMRNWLREELGFDGIIISDDFTMAAATASSPEEAAVLSVAAGADMVLVWPPDLARTHAAFVAALEDGRLSRERAEDAVARIVYEKLRLGIM